NPSLNGWFALDGSEINDNGCVPLSLGLDKATVGPTTYFLQREFNNAGVMVDDPFVAACAPSVGLDPQFVVPSPIDAGDVVQFDGAESRSTLLAPPTSQTGKSTTKPALSVRVALMPQGLKGILRSGLALNVTANQSANGILTLSIPRGAAKRAHIRAGSSPAVVIGRGTVSGIHSGSNHLHVHLPKATAAKLKR